MTTDELSERVLVLAPRGRDSELTCTLLAKAGYRSIACACAEQLVSAVHEGAACAIITLEALAPAAQRELAAMLEAQPPWSDFPLIVLAHHGPAPGELDLGNMTVIERPVSPATLVTAVSSALRARRRQYEARAAIQQRDQFLAMLGHELRNPLATIVLASEPWQERTAEKLEANLQLIARQSGHLTRLVDDLLDVARVTQGKVRLQREAVDTVQAIEGCIANLASRFEDHGIAISSATTPAIIDADPVRLDQIINNLLNNALKYSRAGTHVTVTTRVHDGTWEMRVRDEGIGIAPDMLPRVFDLFAQADASLARANGGMGIGLTLVARLVALHGGSVRATSEGIDAGSEFVVAMPVGTVRRVAAAPPVRASVDGTLSVVLVEDNADLRALSKSLLETFGCQVEVAGDGNQGLELILSTKPELAIVDIGLPGIDGFTIAERVRRSLGDSLTMIAVTGFGQQYDRTRALASGFDAHVIKPLRTAAVHSMLDQARAHRTALAKPA